MADRRQSKDRRTQSRRRKIDGRFVAIELAADELRVAELVRSGSAETADRATVKAYRWRREASSLHTAQGRQELTAAFRDVARERSLTGASVRIVLSGAFCIMRTARGTVEEVRTELAQLGERSRHYLTLGPGEKVMVTSTRSLDARHVHALAAACNRATLDAISAAAEAAGFEVAFIEPALSALSRVVNRLPGVPDEPCVVVHFDRQSVEVGVCRQGELLVDYRPGGRACPADLPKILESHLVRLSRHVGRFVKAESQSLSHVFLCGDPDAVREAKANFNVTAKLDVHAVVADQVQATWQLTDEGHQAATAAVLGGLLSAYSPDGLEAPNLMQDILDRKREPLRPVLVRSAIPLAAAVLISLGLAASNHVLQRTVDQLQTESDQLAVAKGRALELRVKLNAADAKLAQLEKLASQLPVDLRGASIRGVGSCLPNDVWLSRFELIDGNSARLEGASYIEAGVYDFVRWLEQAPLIEEVALKRTSPGMGPSGPITGFELELHIQPEGAPPKVARHE